MSIQAESDSTVMEEGDISAGSGKARPAFINPFNDESISGLFFPGAGRQETLDQLKHLLRYGPSLLILYGDQGVGKHFLVDHLVSQLDLDLFDLAVMNADIMVTSSTLLSKCTDAWHSRQPLTLENFKEKSATLASDADEESKILLCLIRHGQFLDEETCQVIAAMLASCAGLPVKFLVVVDALELEEAEQIHALTESVPDHYPEKMNALSTEETGEYLSYRLRTAGMGQVKFNQNQVDQIFNHSLGNLVRVNEIAHALLLSSMPKPKEKKAASLPIPWLHVVALAVVAVALLILYAVTSPSPQTVEAISAEQKEILKQPVEVESSQAIEPKQAAVSSGQVEQEQPSTKVVQAQTSLANPIEEAPDAKKPEQNKREQQPVTKVAPKPETTEPKTPEPKVAATPVQPELTPKPIDERTAWIVSLPKDHYSVQLLGAKELKTVERFLSQYPSLQNLVYYRTTRNGAPWFVVVQGNYSNYDAAKAATLKYPEKLRKQGPWIRKVEAIQKDLKK